MIKSNTVDEKPGDVNIALAALAHEISMLQGYIEDCQLTKVYQK